VSKVKGSTSKGFASMEVSGGYEMSRYGGRGWPPGCQMTHAKEDPIGTFSGDDDHLPIQVNIPCIVCRLVKVWFTVTLNV
jgi:hypothetical protein